jgi:hypothetical protein
MDLLDLISAFLKLPLPGLLKHQKFGFDGRMNARRTIAIATVASPMRCLLQLNLIISFLPLLLIKKGKLNILERE